jgi:hypothetical protein
MLPVKAVDFCDKFIDIARAKSASDINYRVLDVTKKKDLEKLAEITFDSAVCTMALMDVENIEVLIDYLPFLLKRDGIFVFSVLHPCFNSGQSSIIHEQNDAGDQIVDNYYVKIAGYLKEKPRPGIGIPGQPQPHYYFHRPLSSLLRPFFRKGFFLDALEEPSFPAGEAEGIFRNVFSGVPPALVCRLKLLDCR